jgi:hypothetical protein
MEGELEKVVSVMVLDLEVEMEGEFSSLCS